ncbi:unnamed protein product [Gordionus sp. m RMFG-2023]
MEESIKALGVKAEPSSLGRYHEGPSWTKSKILNSSYDSVRKPSIKNFSHYQVVPSYPEEHDSQTDEENRKSIKTNEISRNQGIPEGLIMLQKRRVAAAKKENLQKSGSLDEVALKKNYKNFYTPIESENKPTHSYQGRKVFPFQAAFEKMSKAEEQTSNQKRFENYRKRLLDGYSAASKVKHAEAIAKVVKNDIKDYQFDIIKHIKNSQENKVGRLSVSSPSYMGDVILNQPQTQFTPLSVIAKLMPLTLASHAGRDFRSPYSTKPKIQRLGYMNENQPFETVFNVDNNNNPINLPHLASSYNSYIHEDRPQEQEQDHIPSESQGYDGGVHRNTHPHLNIHHNGGHENNNYNHKTSGGEAAVYDRGHGRDYANYDDNHQGVRPHISQHGGQHVADRGQQHSSKPRWEGNPVESHGQDGPFYKKSPAVIYDAENGYGHDSHGLVDSYENVMLEKDLGFGGFCNDKENGLYADQATKCQLFYACEWGRSHQFTCPYGTAYNTLNYKCDWNYNVEC